MKKIASQAMPGSSRRYGVARRPRRAGVGPASRRRRWSSSSCCCSPTPMPWAALICQPTGTGVAPSSRWTPGVARPGCRPGRRCARGPSAGRPCCPGASRPPAPRFWAKTISSCPHGIRTRYCVLTPVKLASVTTPPGSDVAAAPVGARPRRTSWIFSGRTPMSRSSSPLARRARRHGDLLTVHLEDEVVAVGARHGGPDQVGLAEEVGDERRGRATRRARPGRPAARCARRS